MRKAHQRKIECTISLEYNTHDNITGLPKVEKVERLIKATWAEASDRKFYNLEHGRRIECVIIIPEHETYIVENKRFDKVKIKDLTYKVERFKTIDSKRVLVDLSELS
jgi:hypothetical protein